MFKGVLHKLGIGRREAVLGGERLARPNRGAISRCDIPSAVNSFCRNVADCSGSSVARPFATHAVATLSIIGASAAATAGLCHLSAWRAFVSWRRRRARTVTKIGCIQIVLAGDADEREQGISAGVGQRCAHALRIGSLGYGADRPIRCDPLAGGVGQHGGQIDHAAGLIDGGGLDRGDLVLPQRLAHDVEAT